MTSKLSSARTSSADTSDDDTAGPSEPPRISDEARAAILRAVLSRPVVREPAAQPAPPPPPCEDPESFLRQSDALAAQPAPPPPPCEDPESFLRQSDALAAQPDVVHERRQTLCHLRGWLASAGPTVPVVVAHWGLPERVHCGGDPWATTEGLRASQWAAWLLADLGTAGLAVRSAAKLDGTALEAVRSKQSPLSPFLVVLGTTYGGGGGRRLFSKSGPIKSAVTALAERRRVLPMPTAADKQYFWPGCHGGAKRHGDRPTGGLPRTYHQWLVYVLKQAMLLSFGATGRGPQAVTQVRRFADRLLTVETKGWMGMLQRCLGAQPEAQAVEVARLRYDEARTERDALSATLDAEQAASAKLLANAQRLEGEGEQLRAALETARTTSATLHEELLAAQKSLQTQSQAHRAAQQAVQQLKGLLENARCANEALQKRLGDAQKHSQERDRALAVRAQAIAERDQARAERDRARAQALAERDQARAARAQALAERDQARAERDRARAQALAELRTNFARRYTALAATVEDPVQYTIPEKAVLDGAGRLWERAQVEACFQDSARAILQLHRHGQLPEDTLGPGWAEGFLAGRDPNWHPRSAGAAGRAAPAPREPVAESAEELRGEELRSLLHRARCLNPMDGEPWAPANVTRAGLAIRAVIEEVRALGEALGYDKDGIVQEA